MDVVIDVDKVTKVYASERGPVHALGGFSMQVEKGERFEWLLEDRNTLVLRRLKPRPALSPKRP